MAVIRFTQNTPDTDRLSQVCEYAVTSFDIVSDPMTIEITNYPAYNYAGEETTSTVNRSFTQADWTGEEL